MTQHDDKLQDELGRLAALRRYSILDTPPEEPFDKLTKLVQNVLGVPIAAVSLIDAERQWFKSVAGLHACETSRDVAFCAYTIKARDPLVIPDATLDRRFMYNPLVTGDPRVRSYIGVPLETPDGYNLGALCAVDMKPRNFDASQIEIMKSFAALILNDLELRQIAMSDSLTGAMTRRGWLEIAEKEFARSARYGTDAAIIMFDVDHFKAVNDTHGHSAGDMVLRTLTKRCLVELRNSDSLGRIGGEEFAVLLPNTNLIDAAGLAERLRQQFADTPVAVDGVELFVTASFGIVSLHSDLTTIDACMAKADGLLYDAKASGRNCCRSA